MDFSFERALAVFWKDALDLRKNKALLFSMAVLPLVLVLAPIGVIWAYAKDASDPSLGAVATFYQTHLPAGMTAAEFLIEKALADWFGLYLMMPVFVPILISSQSVAGEKERRTLEPLLASPVTAAEFLLGKSLASMVPAVALTWGAFVLFCCALDFVTWPYLHRLLLPNGMWLFGVAVIAPLFAFFGNGVAVLISARVNEVRLAQQLSGLCVLPVVGLAASQVAGWLRAGTAYYAMEGAVVLVLDVILLLLSVRLFDRERLLSRWT